MSDTSSIRYRAFISYSHKDLLWVRWLQKALEKYRVDRDLVDRETPFGKIPPTLRPIFVDRDDFASGSSLSDATIQAINASEFLIVICSPRAAQSFHVNEEVRLFKVVRNSGRIVPIIVDGEPGDPELECFPPALKYEIGIDGSVTSSPVEPIAADAREIADGREVAKLKVIAGLLGVGLDDVRKRAVRAARRRAIALASTAVVMGILAVLAAVAAWIAHSRAIEAEQRLEWALETAGSITSKTVTFKDKFGVPAPVLAELLQEVERLLGRLSAQGVTSAELVSREAVLLGALSDGNVSIGNSTKALQTAQQAAGNSTKALQTAQQAAAKFERLVEMRGNSPQQQNDLAWARMKIGDILESQNRGEEGWQE